MKIFRYDPNQSGLARWLGAPLSAPLMAWLWEQQCTMSVGRVTREYPDRLNYNTCATTLDRLVGYGLLSVRKRNNVRYYTPKCTRDEWEAAQYKAIKASIEAVIVASDDGWGHGGWE